MAAGDFRDRLLSGLGGNWPKPGPLKLERHESEQLDRVTRTKVSYEVEPGERIAAWLLVPDDAGESKKAPGICLWHQHNGAWQLGASEPAGLAGMKEHHTGLALAREGYVVLCPDALGFGERSKGYKQTGGNLERFLFLKYVVAGKCLAWKHILDMKRAVDAIASLPETNAEQIGCYGHSMGSTHTWLVGPWEPRLKALCGNCCLPTYAGILREQMLHCFPNFVPGIHQYGDTPDIAALIAPRPLHLNFGEFDGGSPIDEVRRGIEIIRKSYQSMHAEDKFTWFIEEGAGHVLSETMWSKIKSFFALHLRA